MVAERVWFYNILRGAAVQSAYSEYRKILNLLYLGQFFLHTTGSGITFILFATLSFLGNRCGSFFCWRGMTRNSFIYRSLLRVGRAVGITFICDC